MNDPRVDEVIAAVEGKFPGSRVKVGLDPDPHTMRVPIFTILLDADRQRLRAARDFALELTFKTFRDEPVPYFVVAVTAETEAKYQRDVARALAQEAASKS